MHTDCYVDKRAAEITGGVVEELASQGYDVRILTRNTRLLTGMHLDLYKEYSDHVIVGSSINSLNDDVVQCVERFASPPSARLEGLQEIADAGIPTYVSMSPTYPTMDREDIHNLLAELATVDPRGSLP